MMTVPNFLDFTVNAVVLYCNLYILHFEYFCQISSKLILTILSYTVSMLVHFLRQCRLANSVLIGHSNSNYCKS